MSQEIVTAEKVDIMSALKSSLFPGASDVECELVLAFCRAAGMNPLLKPVHLVPMYNSRTKKKEMTVMPGIGMYRINAERSQVYVGLSEPEFGEDVTEQFPEEEIEYEYEGKKIKKKNKAITLTYPKWCKITVMKLVAGEVRPFMAKEIWKENFATAGKDSSQPNEMWRHRPYGQLAKCAEAQALRKAFPDRVSSQPTAEEVEANFSGTIIEADGGKTQDDPLTGPKKTGEGSDSGRPARTSGRSRKRNQEGSPPPETNVPQESPLPNSDRVSPEELKAIKTKWEMICKQVSQKTQVEGAAYLRQRFRFQSFEEVHPDQLIELMVAMNEIRES